jgi:hypothetical protein
MCVAAKAPDRGLSAGLNGFDCLSVKVCPHIVDSRRSMWIDSRRVDTPS